jgi:thioredoxin-like negative regulator of GroEL
VTVKLNTDERARRSPDYGIRSIPTVMIFWRQAVFDTVIGAVPKDILKEVQVH